VRVRKGAHTFEGTLVGPSTKRFPTGPFSSAYGVVLEAADGKQFVAFGIHPGTGKPYQWIADNPATKRLDDVPVITAALRDLQWANDDYAIDGGDQ